MFLQVDYQKSTHMKNIQLELKNLRFELQLLLNQMDLLLLQYLDLEPVLQ